MSFYESQTQDKMSDISSEFIHQSPSDKENIKDPWLESMKISVNSEIMDDV